MVPMRPLAAWLLILVFAVLNGALREAALVLVVTFFAPLLAARLRGPGRSALPDSR